MVHNVFNNTDGSNFKKIPHAAGGCPQKPLTILNFFLIHLCLMTLSPRIKNLKSPSFLKHRPLYILCSTVYQHGQ